ncbi:hypothetical protein J437_LFUL011802 [Ladona fulva]|uniref:FAM86 N-terminal domain-containing protein n=1 Tax=Ladona fulva TaxID=123851 RepID=A0A8K0P640_LADFU|nr:hypothetical protein J437_LFUL011802 [Ladona fulva]
MGRITLEVLEKLFLSGYPLNKWCWPDIFEFLLDGGAQKQHFVLTRTINHRLTRKYPLKLSYQLAFLKKIINKLEENQVEVIDQFYEAYTKLLCQAETERDYRHFPLNCAFVSIKESSKLVSEGTTGLHVWQASMALAEWCLKNKDTYLKGRNILELGSGIGLTGLACILGTKDILKEVSQECMTQKKKTGLCCLNHEPSLFSPKCFTFSDCHPSVLKLLCQNVKHNLVGDDNGSNHRILELEDGKTKRIIFNTDHYGTEVRIIKLPWEDVNEGCEEAVTAIGDVDFILAADVVYDELLFTSLVGSLRRLLSKTNTKGEFPSAIIACTMRNKETIEAFLDQLCSSGLKIRIEHAVKPQHFVYETDPPVFIYNVTCLET